jgi:hypothetical protein
LFLEDYVVQFHYIKGESNSLTDALSCLPFDERQNPPDQHDHLQQWNPPAGLNDAHAIVDATLADAMYATHASFHSGLQTIPGALAFHHNMVMNIPLMLDLMLVQQN